MPSTRGQDTLACHSLCALLVDLVVDRSTLVEYRPNTNNLNRWSCLIRSRTMTNHKCFHLRESQTVTFTLRTSERVRLGCEFCTKKPVERLHGA